MSIYTKSTKAKIARMVDSQKVMYAYALILVVFILCQLFTFDDFLILLEGFWPQGGLLIAHIFCSFIVVCELFALPFLLNMNLRPSIRIISMVMGWIVPLVWTTLSLWIILTANDISNIGFLGTVVKIMPSWWAVGVGTILCMLAVLPSWILWPDKQK